MSCSATIDLAGMRADGARDTDDLLEELLLLVAARLAAVPDGGAGFRGAAGRSRRPGAAAGAAAAVALGAGAAPDRTTTSRSGTRWRSPNISHEIAPEAGLLPADQAARAHCRAVSGEMHSGFYNLRSALPMNLKARHETFKIFSGARPGRRAHQDDLDRMPGDLWRARSCSATPTVADAMYAPVCTRFRTYAVELEPALAAYCETVFDWPLMAGMDRRRRSPSRTRSSNSKWSSEQRAESAREPAGSSPASRARCPRSPSSRSRQSRASVHGSGVERQPIFEGT